MLRTGRLVQRLLFYGNSDNGVDNNDNDDNDGLTQTDQESRFVTVNAFPAAIVLLPQRESGVVCVTIR